MEGSGQCYKLGLLYRDDWWGGFCFQCLLIGYHPISSLVSSLAHEDTCNCEYLKVWKLQWQVAHGGAAGRELFSYVNISTYRFTQYQWEAARMCLKLRLPPKTNIRVIQ